MPDLYIFHHHLLTGGVTSVILKSVEALKSYLPEVDRIYLVTGKKINFSNLHLSPEVEVKVMPEIDYLEWQKLSGQDRPPADSSLAGRLIREFASDNAIWWVHNYHLGKNPLFTRALLDIIYGDIRQKIVLQIHDFPECGRYENLALLESIVKSPLYPLSPEVQYVVLNKRDYNILITAGIPQNYLSLLENPISPYTPPHKNSNEKKKIKQSLSGAFGASFPSFIPDAPLIIYPIRTIRRKNVMEAGLITHLMEEPVNLIATLPGISGSEIAYSNLIQKCFEQGLIPGLWGIGEKLEAAGLSFEKLIEAGDLIISTAVQEGFGYLFINALQWRRPLLARDLDILEDTKDLFSTFPSHFYSKVTCPLSESDRNNLIEGYTRKLMNLSGVLSDQRAKELIFDIEELLAKEAVDFSFLTPDLQYRLLKQLDSVSFKDEVIEINRVLVEQAGELLYGSTLPGISSSAREAELQRRYSYRSYAAQAAKILKRFKKGAPSEPQNHTRKTSADQKEVIRQFARLEYIRLLN
ncbi:MAG: hypothetical protein GH155_04230, partial [Spirochaeta sp.]|nr:hypothetical protein [Spirochaeta sp.]